MGIIVACRLERRGRARPYQRRRVRATAPAPPESPQGPQVSVTIMTSGRGRTFRWITLTTDYGLSDGFVAAVHGVLGQRAPGVRVLDVTHLVPPGDVARGAAVLAQTVVHLPLAVHVAVVDPGVGSARRGLAIETPNGLLVGPDNGLLIGAATTLGGIS